MIRSLVTFGLALAALSLASCASPLQDEAWREPRPLGADVSTYRPPRTPEPRADIADIVEPDGDLTLARAVSLALIRNPRLEAFAWDVRIAEARTIQASLPPNPVGGVGVENFGGSGSLSGFDNSMTTIRIGQLIELAGKREKRTDVAKHDAALAGWDYEQARLDVLVDTTRRFIDVLAHQRRVELAKRTLKLTEQVHKIVSDRVGAGVAPPPERDRASVRLSQERIRLQRAQRLLASARHQLAAAWDEADPHFDHAVGDLSDIAASPQLDAVAPLLAQNPSVARWDDEIAQRTAAIESQRAQGVPDVTVGPGIRYLNDIDEHALVFEASLPIPISDRNQGNVLAARYARAKARAEQRDSLRRARAELADAVYQLHAARGEAEILRTQTLPAARAAFDAAKRSFREGAIDYTTVLDTERTYIETQQQEIEALSEYQELLNRVEGLTGQRVE